jgi:hypothetical protein
VTASGLVSHEREEGKNGKKYEEEEHDTTTDQART